jgi:hypothetical protein
VQALYQGAGLDLAADLSRLASAQRLGADPAAVQYLAQHPSFSGRLQIPMLALESTGDDWLVNAVLDYRSRVAAAKSAAQLREAWVTRPGHCPFSRLELATALDVLLQRVDKGRWPSTGPSDLASRARSLMNQSAALKSGVSEPIERFTVAVP